MIIITAPPERLIGEIRMPGDKSITHRALILGALARGVTEIKGYLDAEDTRSTIECLRLLGVSVGQRNNRILVEGINLQLKEPKTVLNAGNSGTTARLLLGVLAGQPFSSTLTGDHSLQQRPMKRVVEPLSLMGASFCGPNEKLPLTVKGGKLTAIAYESPQASAQVKSAVLLAGLYCTGETSISEPYLSRNHTELMLQRFGAKVTIDGSRITLGGNHHLRGGEVRVPGDLSAAAFFMVAAAIVPGSEVLIRDVGINPTRDGIIEILQSMGADLEIQHQRFWGKELVADILIKGGKPLKGLKIEGKIIPRLIDELPVIAVAAALAEGKTEVSDALELRVKESDRISALCGELQKLGVRITEKEDGFVIEGGFQLTGADLDSCGDHRLAMALAVAGLAASGETGIYHAEAMNISFPSFMSILRSLVTK